MKTHVLKTWPPYFEEILAGKKTFEIRQNDRDYKIGDNLHLKEWKPNGYSSVSPSEMTGEFTGRELKAYVTYIFTNNFPLNPFIGNTICMSIEVEGIGILLQKRLEFYRLETAKIREYVFDSANNIGFPTQSIFEAITDKFDKDSSDIANLRNGLHKAVGLLTNIRHELDYLPDSYYEWIDKVLNETDDI